MSAPDTKPAPAAAKPAAAPKAAKPPLKELKQNRWQIENYTAGQQVELSAEEVKREHTVYVANCSDTVVQVRCAAGAAAFRIICNYLDASRRRQTMRHRCRALLAGSPCHC